MGEILSEDKEKKAPVELDAYEPTEQDLQIADYLDGLAHLLASGELQGLACCAKDIRGRDVLLCINKASTPVLGDQLAKLVRVYNGYQGIDLRDNAPLHNRSYRSH